MAPSPVGVPSGERHFFNGLLDYIRVPHTLDEMIARFKDKPLNFAPGAKWEYSNSGYILLGLIIEIVSGQTYEDFLSENIFTPLGMTSSGCFAANQDVFLPASLRNRRNSSWSAQTIRCLPDGVRR